MLPSVIIRTRKCDSGDKSVLGYIGEWVIGSCGLVYEVNTSVVFALSQDRYGGHATNGALAGVKGKSSGFSHKRQRLDSQKAVLIVLSEILKRRLAHQGENKGQNSNGNVCTLCKEVQERSGVANCVTVTADGANYSSRQRSDSRNSDSEESRHYRHSTVDEIFELQDKRRSLVFLDKRENSGESLPLKCVRKVVFGSTPERKVCQLLFQAFYKTSMELDYIQCPILRVRVPEKETSPMATFETGLDETERIMLVETAISVMRHMEKYVTGNKIYCNSSSLRI